MQDDTSIENLHVMTETAREYGSYSGQTSASCTPTPPCDVPSAVKERTTLAGIQHEPEPKVHPGVCLCWQERLKDLPQITGSPDLIKKIWEDIDAFGNMYIWQLLLSF